MAGFVVLISLGMCSFRECYFKPQEFSDRKLELYVKNHPEADQGVEYVYRPWVLYPGFQRQGFL